jgi:zinc transport system substrate-binding protein
VYTVNYPLQYFAQRIGGDEVEVVLPAPAGSDPAMWTPGIQTVTAFQEADVILLNGAGYAAWVDRVSLPPSKLVNTSAAVADRYVLEKGAATHSHGPEGEHAHGDVAFTTWLDATIAIDQARAVAAAFSELRPGAAAAFESGLAGLEADLMALDSELTRIAATVPGRPLLASHPVYQYLAGRYGLNLVSLHWEPDGPPNAAMAAEVDEILAHHRAATIIWEATPNPATVEMLRERGIESVVFDPAAGQPASGDYLSLMRDNAANLALAF